MNRIVKLALPILLVGVSMSAAEEWRLVGREGDCAPLSLLERRGAEFRGIEGPDHLVKKMQAAGHKVEIKKHSVGSRPAVEVRVPSRGLYVMFVKAELCNVKGASEDAKQPGPPARAR